MHQVKAPSKKVCLGECTRGECTPVSTGMSKLVNAPWMIASGCYLCTCVLLLYDPFVYAGFYISSGGWVGLSPFSSVLCEFLAHGSCASCGAGRK